MKKGRKQELKREQAITRQKLYDSLTLDEKLSLISMRRGISMKEIDRLYYQSNNNDRLMIDKRKF